MIIISNSEFSRVVSRARDRQLAHNYLKNNFVRRIHIEDKGEKYHIAGTVMVEDYLYTPHITINKYNKVIQTSCDCEYSDAYVTCAHTGAILLKLQDLLPSTFPFDFINDKPIISDDGYSRVIIDDQDDEFSNYSYWHKYHIEQSEEESSRFMQDIITKSKNILAVNESGPVKLEIHVYGDSRHVELRFKIGRKRLYMLKSIKLFLDDMHAQNYHYYGKDFSWIHNYSEFDEPSKKIFDYIRNYFPMSETSRFILTFDSIGAFGNLLKELPKNYYYGVDIRAYTEKIRLDIKHTSRDVEVRIEDKINCYTYHNDVYFQLKEDDFTLGFLEGDSQGILSKFMNHIREQRNILYINNRNKASFYSYVLSPIKDYFDIHDKENNLIEEDYIEIYGDLNENDEAVFEVYGYYQGKKENLIQKPDLPMSLNARMILSFLEDYRTDCDGIVDYFDIHDSHVVEFLMEGMNKLTQFANVYISELLKNFGTKKKMTISVGISLHNDLLDIDIDAIGIPKEELAQVLKNYRAKKKYYRLKNGEMISLDAVELEELSNVMDKFHLMPKDMVDGHFDINVNKAYAIDQMANSFEKVMVNRSETFKNQIESIQNYKAIPHKLNEHYKPILRDYQKDGFQWLSTMSDLSLGGVLADDMGLGKTLQIISLLESRQHHFTIVVCPSSLVLNWQDEIHKFSSTLKQVCIMGTSQERQELISRANDYDIIITSYDYMRRDYEHYKPLYFDYIILDEAQYIKNQKTKNAQSVKKLNGRHKFALTGTPIENSLAELWSIFDFLNRDYLYNYTHFRREYESPIVKEQNEEKQEELKRLIAPFVLRRTKSEVLKELPDKVEKNITIEFSDKEKKLYFANLAQANRLLKGLDSSKDKIQILAMLIKLRQICCESRMVYEEVDSVSSKMNACLDIIENYHENHKKILVFSSFTTVLDLLAVELEKKGISYMILTGTTPKDKRKEMVDYFQEKNNNVTVFLISLKAGGTGLNLTQSEGVIHFDPWWNMSAQNQATDRAHRIGQKNTVFVYKLIMKDSIEEKIQELQEKKKALADTFVEGNEGVITKMSNEEILSLFE